MKSIRSIQDIHDARGDIKDKFGRIVLSRRDILRGDFADLPPLRGHAREGARAYIGELLVEYFDVNVQGSVGQCHNVFVQEERENNPLLRQAFMNIERKLLTEYRNELEQYDWHDFTAIADRNGTIFLEMGMDIRIREYYETRIRNEVRVLEQQD